MINKTAQRVKRHNRIRLTVKGTNLKPRLTVFRSNKHIYAQIIDDQKSTTLVSASDFGYAKSKENGGKIQNSTKVGVDLAQRAKTKKITDVVFDRGGFKFHGRIKALAESARKGGLKF